MHHIGALAGLAAKALAEEVGDIGLVVDDQDADAHADPPRCCDWLLARQADGELGERARLALDRDRAAVLLGDDVVADRQTEPGALAGRLGREERLEQLVPDLGRDAGAVVAHPDLDGIAEHRGSPR